MQTNMINVPSTVADPMYRYKMPQMKLKIEGRGNGVKTNIVNMPDVASALNMPTDFPLRFLAYELGSQVTYLAGTETTCIINGEFEIKEMQKNLDKFIKKYICCAKCTLPEVTMKVIDNRLKGDCRSCGHQSLLDNKHRIASYIVKTYSGNTAAKGASKTSDGTNKLQTAVSAQATMAKKKKLLILGDDELKEFRPKLAEAAFPLDPKSPLIVDLVKVYATQFAKAKAEENISHAKLVEKAYRNLKTLKIPRDKQVLYGYLLFNTLFSKNVGNQVKEQARLVQSLWEVSIPI